LETSRPYIGLVDVEVDVQTLEQVGFELVVSILGLVDVELDILALMEIRAVDIVHFEEHVLGCLISLDESPALTLVNEADFTVYHDQYANIVLRDNPIGDLHRRVETALEWFSNSIDGSCQRGNPEFGPVVTGPPSDPLAGHARQPRRSSFLFATYGFTFVFLGMLSTSFGLLELLTELLDL
jgi:hypothetical protein